MDHRQAIHLFGLDGASGLNSLIELESTGLDGGVPYLTTARFGNIEVLGERRPRRSQDALVDEFGIAIHVRENMTGSRPGVSAGAH
jgi:hypothetical protein